MAYTVKLTKGYVAIVDDEDASRVSKHSWCANVKKDTVYVLSRIGGRKKYGGRLVSLHEFILGKKDGFHIDHIDGDGLNNQKSNLRYATVAENMANQRVQDGAKKKSQYKGVTLYRTYQLQKPWFARIKKHGQQIYLGYFKTEEEAAQAYNSAAKKHFGEFARLNQIA